MRHSVPIILFSTFLLLGPATLCAAKPFNCEDIIPRSEAYDRGNYDVAFREIEPIAKQRCPEAEHLLGVMYAKGRGVQQDLVQAYALLLLADVDGMEPVGKAAVPTAGDDASELEIVQFGAQLTAKQIDQAESLATKLSERRGKFATAEAGGPSEISRSANELRPRLAGYGLNGKLAAVDLPNVATPISLGMSKIAPGHVLAEVLTEANAMFIPIDLATIGGRLAALGRGYVQGDDEVKRAIAIAEKYGTRFAWLKAGANVRIMRFALNGGFAAQVQIVDETNSSVQDQSYWIDSCFLTMKEMQDQVRHQIARSRCSD
jgi:hypothetical protein